MKKICFSIGIILAGILCLNSCQDATPYEDMLYFTGTESSVVKRISTENPTSIGLSVTASCKVESEVTVNTEVNAAKVEEYNKKEGTSYKLLPENTYKFSSTELKIEQGEHVSKSLELTIQNLDKFEPEVTYLLPVSIVQVQGGGLSVLEASRTVYIIVSKPLRTYAANISSRYFKIPFENHPSSLKLSQLSYEARVCVNKFQQYSPYISTVMGIEGHFNFRFGDVTIKPNQIQIAGDGVETTVPTELVAGKWYHLAAVFDAATVKISVNGKLEISKATTAPWIELRDEQKSRGFYIGRSEGGRPLNGSISEVRVWNKALTAKEIINNMCGVNPLTDGLLAYWRINEGEGNIIHDVTGHGWDAEWQGWGDLQWISNVRCPNE